MMPRPCIRPKKSPPGHHGHNRPVRHPGHHPAGASAATPAGPGEADAPLRPPVSGDGQGVCDAGAPDRDGTCCRWEQEVLPLARAAQAHVHGAMHLSEAQRARLHTQLTAALEAHHRIARQSRRLTQGKALPHCKIVNATIPRLRPSAKGRVTVPPSSAANRALSPSQRRALSLPGICPWAIRVMPAMWCPGSTRWSRRWPGSRRAPPRPSTRWRAIWRCNDAALREALHERGILTVGIPRTVDPLPPSPTPEDVFRSLEEADLHHIRTPTQVHLAYCVWLQPPRGRKHHCQPAVSWSWAPHLQRAPRCDRPNRDGGHGAQRSDIGAHPRVSSVEASTHVPPKVAPEMP